MCIVNAVYKKKKTFHRYIYFQTFYDKKEEFKAVWSIERFSWSESSSQVQHKENKEQKYKYFRSNYTFATIH